MQDISIHDELVVKWYEMAQLGLPVSFYLIIQVGNFELNCRNAKIVI